MGQFYGLYRGICSNNKDPEKRFRVRLKIPQLLGDHETAWAWPCVPPGWYEGVMKSHDDHVFTDNDTGDNAGGSSTETLIHSENHETLRPVPRPGDKVWVMFEAGDIEKPVWMGIW